MSSPEKEVTLCLGDVHVAHEPTLVRTLLGSCIAVCLYDPLRALGGMNHFLLPRGRDDDGANPRFGVPAMELLIGGLLEVGASPRRLVAKVFGGAHVLDIEESEGGVPQQNIAFVRGYLEAGGIPIVAEDLGGYRARHVQFHTGSGRVFVKRSTPERTPDAAVSLA
jgi:chemotaxis receptor (MCP) glutamine deamidase CheD